MRVLITGGAGFVGRHFVKRLMATSEEIIIVDNLIKNGGGLQLNDWFFKPLDTVQLVNQDCRKYFEEVDDKFDLVIHLAAVVGGRLTIERDPLVVTEDLAIDSMFWRWVVNTKPNNIISFSSSAAYPVSLQNETHKLLREDDLNFEKNIGIPDLTYGWAKLTNEYLGLLASKLYGLNVACYRPFSGYGYDQSLNYPFPSICKRAIENKGANEFKVWGTGKQKRDFIHIDDLVDAVLYTYESNTNGSAINLCTGIGTSFIELATMACRVLNYNPKICGQIEMPEGVFTRVGDPTLLNSFGWTPRISLEEGVKECVDFLDKVSAKPNY